MEIILGILVIGGISAFIGKVLTGIIGDDTTYTSKGNGIEFKTLTFPNNSSGQREKVKAITRHAAQGWEVVSESITPGKFNGKTACCLAVLCALPCAFCAGSDDGEITVTLKRDTRDNYTTLPELPVHIEEVSNEVLNNSYSAPETINTTVEVKQEKTYEPVLGVETEALIKRALLFLEDGEFDNAERYLEQALNQDAENPRVHFVKLILERKVHNVEELIEMVNISQLTIVSDQNMYVKLLENSNF